MRPTQAPVVLALSGSGVRIAGRRALPWVWRRAGGLGGQASGELRCLGRVAAGWRGVGFAMSFGPPPRCCRETRTYCLEPLACSVYVSCPLLLCIRGGRPQRMRSGGRVVGPERRAEVRRGSATQLEFGRASVPPAPIGRNLQPRADPLGSISPACGGFGRVRDELVVVRCPETCKRLQKPAAMRIEAQVSCSIW